MMSQVEAKVFKNPQHSLERAIAEYKEDFPTPELITRTWQTIWEIDGAKAGLKIDVPACDRTQEELIELEKQGRVLVYVPKEVSAQKSRHLLGIMFPEMQSFSVQEGNPVTVEEEQSGWLDIEVSIDAPNTNTTEKGLRKLFDSQGRKGQSLNTYIIGSQFSKRTTGHYFDEEGWSRLLGSRYVGRVVCAGFDSDGYLHVRWSWRPLGRLPSLGGRSAGVKKT